VGSPNNISNLAQLLRFLQQLVLSPGTLSPGSRLKKHLGHQREPSSFKCENLNRQLLQTTNAMRFIAATSQSYIADTTKCPCPTQGHSGIRKKGNQTPYYSLWYSPGTLLAI